ncbi:MAG: nucleotidyltransferase family protein [Candidatus Poribacteria bacterium]
MGIHIKKSNGYLAYWKERQTETENFHLRLGSEAKNELHQIVSLLAERYGVRRILLFGSLKTGAFTEASDIVLNIYMPSSGADHTL